jgi:hypothetical protein
MNQQAGLAGRRGRSSKSYVQDLRAGRQLTTLPRLWSRDEAEPHGSFWHRDSTYLSATQKMSGPDGMGVAN